MYSILENDYDTVNLAGDDSEVKYPCCIISFIALLLYQAHASTYFLIVIC